MTLPSRPMWRKSSYSDQKDCVEVTLAPQVGVRDTKDREGGQLDLPADAWQAFIRKIV
jgi:hypothetical protein